MHKCFGRVIEAFPLETATTGTHGGGYFMVGDDLVFNPCKLSEFNLSKIWNHQQVWDIQQNANKNPATAPEWHWPRCIYCEGGQISFGQSYVNALRALTGLMSEKARARGILGSTQNLTKHAGYPSQSYTDVFFIPEKYALQFASLCLQFAAFHTHHESAVPTIMYLLTDGPDELEVFNGHWAYEERHHIQTYPNLYMLPDGDLQNDTFAIHPIKLSSLHVLGYFKTWWSNMSCCEITQHTKV